MEISDKFIQDFKNFISKSVEEVIKDSTSREKIDKSFGDYDYYSPADKKLEAKIREYITMQFPTHSILGEELGLKNNNSDYIWFIDPIDGTKFYVNDVPMWTITIALQKNGETIFGIVYHYSTGEFYHATKGKGAFCNQTKLSVQKEKDPMKMIVSFDMTFKNTKRESIESQVLSELIDLSNNFYRIRMIGSGSLSLAWLAKGYFHKYICPIRAKDTFIDIAAGLLIAEEAGAKANIVKVSEDLERVEVGM